MKFRTFLAILLIFALVFAAAEYKSGQQAWKAAEAAFLADGESLDPAIRFAPPVPDEQNFAAIPELTGISEEGEEGDAFRANLERLGFKDASTRWPKYRGQLRRCYMPRQKADLKILHDYFRETALLEITNGTETIADDLFKAIQLAHGDTIAALNAANDRAHSTFLPRADKAPAGESIMMLEELPHLKTAQTVARGLGVYALVAARSDHGQIAAETIETMLRLSEASQANPNTLISHRVAIAIRSMAISSAWEALEQQVWNNQQLAAVQKWMESFDCRQAITDAFRAEALATLQILDLVGSDPSTLNNFAGMNNVSKSTTWLILPWLEHNRASSLEAFRTGLIQPLKQPSGYSEVFKLAHESTEQFAIDSYQNPRKFLAGLATRALSSAIIMTAQHDAELVQAATACALERYYIENKSYPDSLQALVPKFMAKIPQDPMNHRPMRYKKTEDGRYQLHSVGKDGIDNDGGQGEGRYNGDVTWNYIPESEK